MVSVFSAAITAHQKFVLQSKIQLRIPKEDSVGFRFSLSSNISIYVTFLPFMQLGGNYLQQRVQFKIIWWYNIRINIISYFIYVKKFAWVVYPYLVHIPSYTETATPKIAVKLSIFANKDYHSNSYATPVLSVYVATPYGQAYKETKSDPNSADNFSSPNC